MRRGGGGGVFVIYLPFKDLQQILCEFGVKLIVVGFSIAPFWKKYFELHVSGYDFKFLLTFLLNRTDWILFYYENKLG